MISNCIAFALSHLELGFILIGVSVLVWASRQLQRNSSD